MKSFVSLFAFLIVSCITNRLNAQSIEHINTIFTVEELEEDLQVLQNKYEAHLTNLYLYTREESLNFIFDSLRQYLTPMNEAAFFNYITPLLSIIKDGHSNIFPSTESLSYYDANSKFFPFQIVFRGERMFIVKNISHENNIAPGTEILSINGESVSNILHFLIQHQVSDGYNTSYTLWIINSYFRDFYSYSYGHTDSFSLVIKNPDNTEGEFLVSGLTKSEIETVKKERFEVADKSAGIILSFPIPGTALLTIKSWDNHMLKQEYAQRFKPTMQNIFNEIFNSDINHLVIDIRDNQGGNMKNGVLLLTYLMDTNFIYINGIEAVKQNKQGERKIISKHSNLMKAQKPNKKTYTGNLTVIINGGSFSNSAIFASRLKTYERAQIVGEESGGNDAVLTGGFGFTGERSLPNSKIIYSRANYRIIISDMDSNTGRGVYPDIYILPTVDDLIQNKDAVLNYCIEHSIPQK